MFPPSCTTVESLLCMLISEIHFSSLKRASSNLIYLRHLSGSRVVREKNSTPSKKMTVLKRKMPVSKDTLSPIEWKEAASVIRRLNWENKCLFGPVQSKTNDKPSERASSSAAVVQRETLVPIIDLSVQECLLSDSEIDSDSKKMKPLDIKHLISFPLFNQNKNFLDSDIFKWNVLRKNLEFLCSGNSSVPSVSSILEKTTPADRVKYLNRWKLSMIQQLGEDGFQQYHRALLNNGASLHCIINSYLTSTELQIKEENKGHWESLKQVFPSIHDVKLLEESVMHPFLCYRGIVDCFARYKPSKV